MKNLQGTRPRVRTGTGIAALEDKEPEFQVPEHRLSEAFTRLQGITQEKYDSYLLYKQTAVVFITRACISAQPWQIKCK